MGARPGERVDGEGPTLNLVDLGLLRSQMDRIPAISGREARAMVKRLTRELAKAEAAARAAQKKEKPDQVIRHRLC